MYLGASVNAGVRINTACLSVSKSVVFVKMNNWLTTRDRLIDPIVRQTDRQLGVQRDLHILQRRSGNALQFGFT